MNFLQKSEKKLVKGLVYGFIIGIYSSVLFIYEDSGTLSSYFIDVLKNSIIISIITFAFTLLLLYLNEFSD
ncbi:hypothetical protein E3U55_06465 [Filobacillus milosensis]|uniref:Uncharacterized protein n=1 Tax=Filobacillus milosensis TaxID=94137 RepID=A0A4Y8IUV1_9BACI|nr:hypothetical protein [Filobacillus milosensis]TFB22878.1 hypothetical protein E3U55_06465 [Filobacillus milosensis]